MGRLAEPAGEREDLPELRRLADAGGWADRPNFDRVPLNDARGGYALQDEDGGAR